MEGVDKLGTHYYKALKDKYIAQRSSAMASLETFFQNPVAVAEHGDFIETMDKQVSELVEADDKLRILQLVFDEWAGMPLSKGDIDSLKRG